jgi:protein gp37
MSTETKIQWATSTGNPWIGCTKVSPGCSNCYAAELDANRFSKTMGGGTKAKPVSHWGKGAPRFRTKGFWNDARKWNRDYDIALKGWEAATALERDGINLKPDLAKLGMVKPQRPRIFPSLCDWLDDEVPTEWLADFLKLIHDTPNLDWLLLTKRPQNFEGRFWNVLNAGVPQCMHEWLYFWVDGGHAPRNVWLGVSVEDQIRANERIPQLLRIPAKIRFLSCEPLLGPITFLDLLCKPEVNNVDVREAGEPHLDWAIIGGESGRHARPCHLSWIRALVKECQDSYFVKPFVKQLGSNSVQDLSAVIPEADMSCEPEDIAAWEHGRHNSPLHLKDSKGGDPSEWPGDLRIREFPICR